MNDVLAWLRTQYAIYISRTIPEFEVGWIQGPTDFTLHAPAVGIDALTVNEPTQGSKAILSPHQILRHLLY